MMSEDVEVPCCRGLSKSNTRSLQGGAFIIAFGAAAAFYLYQGGYFPAIQVKQSTCRVPFNAAIYCHTSPEHHVVAIHLALPDWVPRSCHTSQLPKPAGVCSQLTFGQIWLPCCFCPHLPVRDWRQNLLYSSFASHASWQVAQLHRLSSSAQSHDLCLCWHWGGLQERARSVQQ